MLRIGQVLYQYGYWLHANAKMFVRDMEDMVPRRYGRVLLMQIYLASVKIKLVAFHEQHQHFS